MFTTKWLGRLLLIAILALCAWALLWARGADASTGKTQACPLGQFCISQHADNVGAVSGDSINFTVKLRNNLNFASPKLVLRYNVARQVIVRSSKPTGRFRQDVLVWNVPKLEPGDTWTAKVRVEVLAYAKKSVANTATVVYGGQTWRKNRLAYKINDPVVVTVIQQGA